MRSEASFVNVVMLFERVFILVYNEVLKLNVSILPQFYNQKSKALKLHKLSTQEFRPCFKSMKEN